MSALLAAAILALNISGNVRVNREIEHVKVYYEPGRFGGWPANHGMWSWGNEILVGFSRGYYKDLGPERHAIDRDKPEEHCLARSLDGGKTWMLERPNESGYLLPQGNALHGVELPGVTIKPATPCQGGVNFGHPNFAMTLRMSSADSGMARWYYSYDRGHVWEGPFKLPTYNSPGVMARTDYVVTAENECLLFLTAAKPNEREGRPFCARMFNGGRDTEFLSWIGPEPSGYAIMPATARLHDGSYVTVIRRRDENPSWLSAYSSKDSGHTWEFLGNPVSSTGEGNPASLTTLKDGRLCLVYGYRAAPFSMCAKISDNGGITWSDEIVLRNDGVNRDIGYPRSIQRPDGKMVTTYYFCGQDTKPDRYIAATIWKP
jgi:hypothetical protein